MHHLVCYPIPSSCVEYIFNDAFETVSTCYAAFTTICQTPMHQLVCYRRVSPHIQSMLRAAFKLIGETATRPLVCYRMSTTCARYILVVLDQLLYQCQISVSVVQSVFAGLLFRFTPKHDH